MPNIVEITDFHAPELDVYARLTEPQLRSRREPEKGILIAESLKVIESALDMGCEPLSLLMDRRHIQGQGSALIERCGETPVYTADPKVLEQLTGFSLTRGMLCAMRRPAIPSLEEVSQTARRLVVLEGIVDSTNLGAIFRSAAALGMDGILLSPDCCDPFCRRSVRVSMGAVFRIPWARMEAGSWPVPGIGDLRTGGFRTAAMALRDHALSVEDPLLSEAERLAVLLGSEGDGLRPETIDSCDYVVQIPMAHGVDSLNVAAAAAVVFWQLRLK